MSRSCNGKMLPSMDNLVANRPVRGAVFGYEITSQGAHSQGHQVLVDEKQWHECTECQERPACFELSLGRAFMERALDGR